MVRPALVVVADGALSRFGRCPGGASATAACPSAWVRGPTTPAPARATPPRELPRPARRRRQGRARLRLGLPPRRRHGERRAWGSSPPSTAGTASTPGELMGALLATAPSSWGLAGHERSDRPPGACCPWACRWGRWSGPTGCWWAMPPGPSTPSTARASPTRLETGPSRRGASAPGPGRRRPGPAAGLPRDLDDRFGLYYRMGRVFDAGPGAPRGDAGLTRMGFRSRPLMEWALRVMSNLLDPAERAPGRRPIACWSASCGCATRGVAAGNRGSCLVHSRPRCRRPAGMRTARPQRLPAHRSDVRGRRRVCRRRCAWLGVLAPQAATPEKLEPYECGIVPVAGTGAALPGEVLPGGDAASSIFDIEIVFLFAWAASVSTSSAGTAWARSACSPCCSSRPWSTCGGGAPSDWNLPRRRRYQRCSGTAAGAERTEG